MGDVAAHELALDVELASRGPSRSGLPPESRRIGVTTIRGRLEERTLLATPAETVSLLAVEAPRVSIEGKAERWPAFEAALAQGLVVARDGGGTIRRVRLPRTIAREAVATLITIADVAQVTTAPAEGATWTLREPCSKGLLDVTYTRSDGGAFVKRITALVEPGPSAAPEERVTGEVSGQIHADGLVDRLHGSLAWELSAAGPVSLVASVRMDLRRVPAESDTQRALELTRRVQEDYEDWTAFGTTPTVTASDTEQGLAHLVKGRTLDDFVALLGRAPTDAEARRDVEGALWAYLRLHPEACRALTSRALTQSPDSVDAHVVAVSLLRAGHDEAQRGVEALVRAWRKDPAASSLVMALGSVETPSVETERFLGSLSTEADVPRALVRAGEVGLGNVAERLRTTDPVRADAIAAKLEERLRNATDPADVTTSLIALGNARSERIHDVAKPFLSNDDPQIRRMAVFALGRAESGDAADVLREVAEQDPDEAVRREAKRALGS